MKNNLLIILISLTSTNILGDISYFKCEAKDLFSMSESGFDNYIYKKGENIESLTINREISLVSWRSDTFDFIEDLNKDNIYEIDKYRDSYSISVRFNGVTGILVDERYFYSSGGSRFKTTYECRKTTPVFD